MEVWVGLGSRNSYLGVWLGLGVRLGLWLGLGLRLKLGSAALHLELQT